MNDKRFEIQLPEDISQKLKLRATKNGRSRKKEAEQIIMEAVQMLIK